MQPEGSGEPMQAGHGYPPASGSRVGKMRAADSDRDRVAELLGSAYAEGRLTREEYDDRLESALSAGTFADLDKVIIDLPRPMQSGLTPAMPAPVVPVSATNGLAVASLVCGFAEFVVPVAAIPAIVLGHAARRQIQRSGQQGAGLALTGLLLGWSWLILAIVAVAVFVR